MKLKREITIKSEVQKVVAFWKKQKVQVESILTVHFQWQLLVN